MVCDSNIVSSNSAHTLGVMLVKCMKLDYYISSVCKSTYFHLRNIGSILYCMVSLITVCIVYRKFKTLLQ